MSKPYKTPYTFAAIRLHWGMAVLIVALLALGWLLAEDYLEGPNKLAYVGWHKQLGILVLGLAVARLAWRARYPVALARRGPAWARGAARAAHVALYALMVLMPLNGWLMSSAAGYPVVFLGLELPALTAKNPELAGLMRQIHGLGLWAFVVLVAAHGAAALYHHFVRRDDTLRRMLPFLK